MRKLRGTLKIRRAYGTRFIVQVNQRASSEAARAERVITLCNAWCCYWTRQGAWKKLSQPKGNNMIRILIRKEPPFEIHVVVNPTDALDVKKIEDGGHFHVGDFDGTKQIDEAVSVVATYLELEESHAE